MIRIVTSLLLVWTVFSVSGCNVKESKQWLPFGEAKEELAIEKVLDLPPTKPVFDDHFLYLFAQEKQIAVAVVVNLKTVWLPAMPVVAGPYSVGRTFETAVPITHFTQDGDVAWAEFAEQTLPKFIVKPADWQEIVVGQKMVRLAFGSYGVEQETLEVIALQPSLIVVHCPRSAQGLLFTEDGRWLPARWSVDHTGGCPILRPVDLASFDKGTQSTQTNP